MFAKKSSPRCFAQSATNARSNTALCVCVCAFVGGNLRTHSRIVMADSSMLLLGVPLIVGGCFSSSLGLLLMKRSGEVEVGRPFFLAWRWLCGFLCLAVVQTACDAMSLSYLPLAVVAPFAGLTIVFSLSLAASGCCGEAEQLSRADLLGAVCVLIGVTGVSLAAPHDGAEPSLDEASTALISTNFAVPAAIVLLSAAGCVCAPVTGVHAPVMLLAFGAAACGAMSQLALKVVSLSVKESVLASGGAYFLWPRPLAFVGMGALAFSAPSQLILLSSALAARATLVVPLYQASLVSLTTLAGGTAFKEFASMSGLASVCYGSSMLVATLGIVTLSRGGSGDEGAFEAEDETSATGTQEPLPMPLPPGADAMVTPTAVRPSTLASPLLVEDGLGEVSLDAQFPSSASPVDRCSARTTGGSAPASLPHPRALLRRRSSISLASRANVNSTARLPAPLGLGPLVAMLETREIGTTDEWRGPGVQRTRSASTFADPSTPSRDLHRGATTLPGRQRSKSTYV